MVLSTSSKLTVVSDHIQQVQSDSPFKNDKKHLKEDADPAKEFENPSLPFHLKESYS